MYKINEQQIDYILNDISARGIEMEGLQLNLLDHICCIIEQELEENGDFERGYHAVIRRFYKDKLSEIEEETHLLLTNKNYYVMKKVMITSGTFSAAALTTGIILKYLHAPGASIMMILGIGIASLIFLPLLVTLKIKEQQKAKDKLLIVLGSISAIMMSLAILFKIQHWPGANMMGLISPAILALVFLPIYFVGGIRNPETKLNTIVSSVLIVLGCGLFFSLTITPQGVKADSVRVTGSYLRAEQVVKNEEQQVARLAKADTVNTTAEALTAVYKACLELKTDALEFAAGTTTIGDDFETRNELISNAPASDYMNNKEGAEAKLAKLSAAVYYYNKIAPASLKAIPVKGNIVDPKEHFGMARVAALISDIQQIQLLVLQNQRELSVGEKGMVSAQ